MIAFRCTPEEHKPICEMAAWSGINRQNFIIAKLIESQVEVRPHERAESAERLDDGELVKEVRLAASYGELLDGPCVLSMI